MDISGSMEKSDKLATAKKAAQLFLDKLHVKTDCGLILFDHEMRVAEPPVGDPERVTPHREKLREIIQSAQPMGGTAYLDATAKAIDMMRGFRGRKAVLVMTDGVDLNSKRTLRDVIELAQSAEVPVYTIGVGEPGKMIGTIGVRDLLIVQDGDCLLVAHRKDEEAVKKLVEQMRQKGLERFL